MPRRGAILVFDNAAIVVELMATLGDEAYAIRNTLDNALAPAVSIASPAALNRARPCSVHPIGGCTTRLCAQLLPFYMPNGLVSRGF
jgi:hypothetical protein